MAMNHMNHMHHAMSSTTPPSMMNHHNHHNMSGMGHMSSSTGPTTGMNASGGHSMGDGGHSGHGMGDGGHSGHGMGGGGHSMDGMGGHSMMKMYFHTGVTEYVLFEPCKTDSTKEMVIACVVIFLVAVMYEGLKFLREVLLQRSLRDRESIYSTDNKMSPGVSQEPMVIRGPSTSISSQVFSSSHAIQTFLHIIQIFISYCLMLVFMTYNAWLCVAVVLGAGVGYFAFGWKRAVVVDANEHCH